MANEKIEALVGLSRRLVAAREKVVDLETQIAALMNGRSVARRTRRPSKNARITGASVLEFAATQSQVNAASVAMRFGVPRNLCAAQLSRLTKIGRLSRVGVGMYVVQRAAKEEAKVA